MQSHFKYRAMYHWRLLPTKSSGWRVGKYPFILWKIDASLSAGWSPATVDLAGPRMVGESDGESPCYLLIVSRKLNDLIIILVC